MLGTLCRSLSIYVPTYALAELRFCFLVVVGGSIYKLLFDIYLILFTKHVLIRALCNEDCLIWL